MKILNRWTLEIIFENEKETLKKTLIDALKEGVDLRCADLRCANLEGVDLEDVDLRGVDLTHTNLISANLSGTNLEGADLKGADLISANLRGANLKNTNLEDVNLRNVDLEGAENIRAFYCGEYNRVSFAVKCESGVMYKIGCFWGDTQKAILKVKEKYGENSYYERLINLYTEMLEEEGN